MKALIRYRRAMLAVPVAMTFAIQACTTTSVPTTSREGMTPEQQLLLQQSREAENIKLQAAAGGLGAGALLALIICDSPISFCAAGITAGMAIAGYAAGYYVAEQKNEAENEQRGIQASISKAQDSLDFYEERASTAEAVVRQNRAEIKRLKQSSRATEAERKAYDAAIQGIKDDRDRIEGMSEQLETDIDFLNREIEGRRDVRGEDTSALERERDALVRVNNRMKSQLSALNSDLQSVDT